MLSFIRLEHNNRSSDYEMKEKKHKCFIAHQNVAISFMAYGILNNVIEKTVYQRSILLAGSVLCV